MVVASFLINHFDLFGLRQVWLYFRNRAYTPVKFNTPWLYKLVRHPLYVGWFLTFWCTPTMTVAAHLFFAVMTSAYIFVGIFFEERDLLDAHPEYAEYKRRTPMLVPNLADDSVSARADARLRRQPGRPSRPGRVHAVPDPRTPLLPSLHASYASNTMKTTSILLASAAVLAFTLAAAGFDFDAALLISIGAILGLVGLFVFEYRRVRHRSTATPMRRPSKQRPAQMPASNHTVKFQPPPLVVHTCDQ